MESSISELTLKTGPEQKQELTQKGQKFLELCQELSVIDNDTLLTADDLVTRGAREIKLIKAFIDPHIDRANKAHKALTQDRLKMIAPIKSGQAGLQQKMRVYKEEQDRLRKIEEAKVHAEAHKKQEETQKVEEDRRLAEAERLEKEGRNEEAESVIDAPIPVAKQYIAPVVQNNTPKLNTIFIDKWEADVFNEALVPDEYKIINQGMLNRRAQDTKGMISIPGCRMVNRGTSRTSTR